MNSVWKVKSQDIKQSRVILGNSVLIIMFNANPDFKNIEKTG